MPAMLLIWGDDGFNPHSDAGDKPDFRNTNQNQGVTSDAGFDQSSSSPTNVGNPFGY